MLESKEIPGLIGDKFIEVHKAVEEDPHLALVLLQEFKGEMTLNWLGLYHVVHLAEDVYEQNWFVVQVLKSVYLLLIKVLHFMRSDDLIVIQVNHFEPVVQ